MASSLGIQCCLQGVLSASRRLVCYKSKHKCRCMCFQLRIPWLGNRMVLNTLGTFSVTVFFPFTPQPGLVKIEAFDESLIDPGSSSLASEGVVHRFTGSLGSPCCGIFWSNHTSRSFIGVWRRRGFTLRSCQVFRQQGWLFERGCGGCCL